MTATYNEYLINIHHTNTRHRSYADVRWTIISMVAQHKPASL